MSMSTGLYNPLPNVINKREYNSLLNIGATNRPLRDNTSFLSTEYSQTKNEKTIKSCNQKSADL